MAEITINAALNPDLSWLNRHGDVYQNEDGELHLTLPERLPHQVRDDTFVHPCKEGGEYLLDIAVYYYKNQIANPVDCWEIIAQFQEDPIVDGSVPLPGGTALQIPSIEYIIEVALGEQLRQYPEL
jgi:hypothetical protein